jgi:itaconyl-CoA hydratase
MNSERATAEVEHFYSVSKTHDSNNLQDGPFYEDFVVGRKTRHPQGRSITDADNIWFSLLTCNSNQIHYNMDYAQKNFAAPPFNGKLVANSLLVFSIALGLSVEDTSKNGIMLGVTNLTIKNPTFAGDTIYSETEIIEKRESASHPTMGIVKVKTRGFNQRDTTVVEFERTFMVRKNGEKWA